MFAERKKSVTGRSLWSKLKRKAARRYKSATAAPPVAPLASLLEPLEPRLLLAAVYWDGGGDATNWHDRFNWSGDALPAAADDVTIDVAASPTVRSTSSAGTVTVRSLACTEAFAFSGGTTCTMPATWTG